MNKKHFLLYALILTIFIGFFLFPFLSNSIISYDGAAHIEQANFIKNHTWPNSIVWNPTSFFGYQSNQFYPPLFYLTVATISFVFDSNESAKIITILGYLIFIYATHLFSKTYFNSDKKAVLTTFSVLAILSLNDLVIGSNSFYGLNFFSTIYGGLLPTVLSAGLLFSGLYFLEKSKSDSKSIYYAGLFLGLSILTHFIGFIGFIFIFSYAIAAIFNKKIKEIKKYALIFILTLGTSAWWLVPFLLRFNFSEKAQIDAQLSPYFIVFLIISIISTIIIIKKREKIEVTIISVILILTIFLSHFFIETQIFRILIIFFILSILQLIQIINKKNVKKAIIITIIFIFVLTIITPNFRFFNNENSNYSIQNYEGVGISAINLNNKPAHHQIAFIEPHKKNNFVGNGLFVESSLSSVYVFMTLKTIDYNIPSWGVVTYKVKEGDKNILENKLNILGISYILSNIDFNHPKTFIGQQKIYNIETNSEKIIKYYFYNLDKKPLIESLPYNTIPFAGNLNEWKSLNKKWFVDPSDTIFVKNGKVFEKKEAIVSDINYSKNYQSFSFTIDANEPVAVYIRQSYYPTWHAYQEEKEIPIYLASPNFMIIEGKGRIDFRQEPDFAEYLGWTLTAITLIILILGLKTAKNPHL